jgi:sigma-B regulation protein RsbU (phosphoserine phosphatase)
MPTLRITAMWDPARMVSGDYYDYQLLGPTKVSVVVGDVAGKGISAALLMATVQSSFRSQLRSSLEYAATSGGGSSPVAISTAHLVSSLNQQLHAHTAPEKFSTLFFGIYDEPSRTLSYTNAGHLPPILIRTGSCRRLNVNGMVVGAFAQATYDSSELRLEPGDLLVFFTDGITEPEDAYGEMFGEDRLTDLLIKNAALDDTELVRLIVRSVRQWTGSAELQDDMTLLLIRSR